MPESEYNRLGWRLVLYAVAELIALTVALFN